MPKLGDKIRITTKLYRTYGALVSNRGQKVFWEERSITGGIPEAIYIGYRTLSNGTTYWSKEEGQNYIVDRYFKVAVVVLSERTNPIYVPWYQVNEGEQQCP